MNEVTQRRIISTAAIVVLATTWIAAIQQGRAIPTSRALIGFGFAFFITSIMADLGSSLGASLALIIMVATILENADLILAWVGDRSSGHHGVSSPVKGPRKIAGVPVATAAETLTDTATDRLVIE